MAVPLISPFGTPSNTAVTPASVQMRRKSAKALANRGDIGHRYGVATPIAPREMAIPTDVFISARLR